MTMEQDPIPQPESCEGGCDVSRRVFLGAAVATVAGALTGCGDISAEDFLQ